MTPREREEEDLLQRLRADARAIAAPFGLEFRSIEKTRRDARLYGSCDTDGEIRLRLRSRITGEFLKYSSLVATLCHELAHLRHFSHGPSFTLLYDRLLQMARRQGRYCPSPANRGRSAALDRSHRPAIAAGRAERQRRSAGRAVDPRQLSLFSPEEWGPPRRPEASRHPAKRLARPRRGPVSRRGE